MTMVRRMCLTAGMTGLLLTLPQQIGAQEPRLQGRLPDDIRVEVDVLLMQALEEGLPTEPLIDRALEGASKGASGERILAAVRRLAGELETARDAMGPSARAEELAAGASALRAGAGPEDLGRLRRTRPDQSLTVAAAVLADLVAVGVPVDTAVAAVLVLAGAADDADYIAFRRNVERDVALGASPVAALGVRLDAAAEAVLDQGAGRTSTTPRKP